MRLRAKPDICWSSRCASLTEPGSVPVRTSGGGGGAVLRGRPSPAGGVRPAARGRALGRAASSAGRGLGPAAPPCQRPGEPPQPQPAVVGQPIDISQIPIEFEEPAVTAARTQAAAAAPGAVAAAGTVAGAAAAAASELKPVTQTLVEYVSAGQAGQADAAARRKTITVEQYREMQKKKKVRGEEGIIFVVIVYGCQSNAIIN